MTCKFFSAIWRARLVLLATFSIALLGASPAKAGTTITQSTCPVLVAMPGEYDLATDVGPCLPGIDGIDIVASAVTLHLNGHTIAGSGDPATCNAGHGIRVGLPAPAPMLSLVHVLGTGTISNFQTGFSAENSTGSFVKLVTVTDTAACNNSVGFTIEFPGGHWKLQRNVVRDEGQHSNGIVLDSSNDNELVENDVNNSIVLFTSSDNTILNNTANDANSGFGIALVSFIVPSSNNEIHANTTNNNFTGIIVGEGGTGNNITGNNSFNNTMFDMEDVNPSCDSNKWRGNHFNTSFSPPTTNPSCIQ